MVINEKALVKAMKAAYKGDGYVVGCQGNIKKAAPISA